MAFPGVDPAILGSKVELDPDGNVFRMNITTAIKARVTRSAVIMP
jgi:hypothetical protein